MLKVEVKLTFTTKQPDTMTSSERPYLSYFI